jgi:hypothetical protein
MSIKKYVIGLAAALALGFGTGLYIGTMHNKDVNYAVCKTQKKAYELDRDLRIWTPRVVERAVDAVEDLRRDIIRDRREKKIEQLYKEKISELDEKIKRYESKK